MDWGEFKPCKSDGTITSALPAQEFQLRHFVHLEYDLSGMTGNADLTCDWEWSIVTGEDGGTESLIFKQQVHIDTTLVWFGTKGVFFPTWWYNDAGERISTLIPIKPSILGGDPNAWTQRSDGTWTNPAEQGKEGDDASEALTLTDQTVIIEFWWDSPTYVLDIPSSAKMKFGFHRTPATWPVKYADVGVRTAGSGWLSSFRDPAGFLRLAVPDTTSLYQAESNDCGITFRKFRITPALSSPAIFKDDANRLYCGGWKAKKFYLLMSTDDGLLWSEHTVDIWPSTASDVDMAALADGTLISCARISGALYFKTSRDSWVNTVLVALNVRNRCALPRGAQPNEIVISDGKGQSFVSLDDGETWTPISAVMY